MAELIAALSCACAACGAFLLVRMFFEAPCGRKRTTKPFVWKDQLVSVMELLGHWVPIIRLGNLAPVGSFSQRLQPAMAIRGLSMTWRGCVAFVVTCLVTSAITGAVVSLSILGSAVATMAAAVVLAYVVTSHERRFRVHVAEQMPEVLRSLATTLGAGKSLSQAIEHVGRTLDEPLGPEFLKASFEIKSGTPAEEVVRSLCDKIRAPGMALLGTALQVSQRTGSSLNDLFARTARMVTDDVGLRRELEVKTSQVRLSARIVAAMPVLLAGVLVLLSPDYRAGLALPGGRACLCVAALLDLSALWAVRRLMKGTIS